MSYGHNPHISTIQSLLGYIIWRTISSFSLYNPSLGISKGAQSAHFYYTILPWIYHMAHNLHIFNMHSFFGYIIRHTISPFLLYNPSLRISYKAHNQHISSMQSFLGYIIRRTISNIPSCNPTLDIIWCTNLIKIRCLNRSHIRYTNI